MRLFIACDLPLVLRDALAETSAGLRANLRGRYVPPDSFHVTLAFLGELAGSHVPALEGALSRACAGFEPFSARLAALGSFGRRNCATLWQGFEGSPFDELAESVRSELGESGFAWDNDNSFLAHVTLMRGADLTHGQLPSPVCAEGEISRVVLYSSSLGKDRARYSAVDVIHLRGRD